MSIRICSLTSGRGSGLVSTVASENYPIVSTLPCSATVPAGFWSTRRRSLGMQLLKV